MKTFALVASICCAGFGLSTACTPAPTIDTTLQISLPQTSRTLLHVALEVTQDGIERDVTLDLNTLLAEVNVVAGSAADFHIVVVTADAAGIYAYEEVKTVTPQLGEVDVALQPAAVPSRTGSLIPYFADDTRLAASLELELTDRITGVVSPHPYVTDRSIVLPAGRPVSIRALHPLSGESISMDIGPGAADYGDATPIDVGPSPVPPAGNEQTPGLVAAPSDVVADQIYTLLCARGTSCVDVEWQACDALFDELQNATRIATHDLVASYAEAPDVCSTLQFSNDPIPPQVRAWAAPGHIDSSVSANATIVVSSLEPLRLASLSIVSDGSDGSDGANLCVAPETVDGAGLEVRYQCAIDLSGETPSTGRYDLRVTGEDLGGNAFDVPAYVSDVSGRASNPVIIGIRSEEVGQERVPVLNLGVEIVNGRSSSIVASLQSLQWFDAAGQLVPDFDYFLSPSLAAPTIAPKSSGEAWGAFMSYMSSNLSGTFDITATVMWHDVDSPDTTQVISAVFPVTVQPRPLRWPVGDLVLPVQPLGFGNLEAPLMGGSGESCEDRTLTISDEVPTSGTGAVLDASTSACSLRPTNIGYATLTASELGSPDSTSEVRVEVSAGPTLLALHYDGPLGSAALWRRSPSIADSTIALDATIEPKRLLWESGRDLVIVVGATGLTFVTGPAEGETAVTVAAPCGLTQIQGADIVREQLAIVGVDDAGPVFCEVSLDNITADMAVLRQLTITAPPNCAPALWLPGEHGDRLTGIGEGCAATYDIRGTVAVMIGTTGSSVGLGHPTRVVHDRRRGYAVTLLPGGRLGQVSEAWYTNGSPSAANAPLPPGGTETFAVAIDPMSGLLWRSGTSFDIQMAQYTGFIGASSSRDMNRNISQAPFDFGTTSTRITSMAIDGGSRRLYATTDEVRPRLLLVDFGDFSSSSVHPRDFPGAVVDLLVAGPQPLRMSVRALRPGATVTLSGQGFAGAGRDQVLVDGMACDVLASTTHSVTFRIPAFFTMIDGASRNMQLRVRSHDRLSGPLQPHMRRVPRSVERRSHHWYLGSNSSDMPTCNSGSDCLARQIAFDVRDRALIRPQAGSGLPLMADGAGWLDSLETPAPDVIVNRPGSARILGLASGEWFDRFAPLDYPEVFEPEPVLRQAFDSAHAPTSVLAASPDDRILAAAVSTSMGPVVEFFDAWTFTPTLVPSPPLPLASVDSLTYDGAGSRLLATGPDGAVVLALSNDSASVTVQSVDLGACADAFDGRTLAAAPSAEDRGFVMVVANGPSVRLLRVDATSESAALGCDDTISMPAAITAAEVSPGRDYLAMASDTALYLHRFPTLEPLASTSGDFAAPIQSMAISRDGLEIFVLTSDVLWTFQANRGLAEPRGI